MRAPETYRYNLSADSMDFLETRVARFVKGEMPDKDVVGVVVPHDSLEADFGRTGEQLIFDGMGEQYDFKAGMRPYEGQSTFLFTVDQRIALPEPRIIHIKRIVEPKTGIGGPGWDGKTGIEMIDDRLTASADEERMELDELLRVSDLTIEALKRTLNVATNFITNRTQGGYSLGPMGTLLSYHFLVRHGHEEGKEAILAYQNAAAQYSIDRLGAEKHLLGGKEFHLPKTTGGYDKDYTAFVIPGSKANIDLFLGRTPGTMIARVLGAVSTGLIEYR